jgi:hypothetical protein
MKIFSNPNRTAHVIIHGFAIAHAVLAAAITSQQSDPGIYLTILTISMIVLLALMNDYPLDVTTALTLISCFAGFFLGTVGAKWVLFLLPVTDMSAQIITTTLVTELLGWITYFIVRRTKGKE